MSTISQAISPCPLGPRMVCTKCGGDGGGYPMFARRPAGCDDPIARCRRCGVPALGVRPGRRAAPTGTEFKMNRPARAVVSEDVQETAD